MKNILIFVSLVILMLGASNVFAQSDLRGKQSKSLIENLPFSDVKFAKQFVDNFNPEEYEDDEQVSKQKKHSKSFSRLEARLYNIINSSENLESMKTQLLDLSKSKKIKRLNEKEKRAISTAILAIDLASSSGINAKKRKGKFKERLRRFLHKLVDILLS